MMPFASLRLTGNTGKLLAFSILALPVLAVAGCSAPPSPYYAGRPVVVVAPPQEPATQYVYGTVNSTNTTHITSESTVHIITNHPNDVAAPLPASMGTQTTGSDEQAAEPPPPEEQQPRDEPSAEPASEPADQAAPEPAPEPEPEPAPAPESSSSGSAE